jgi:NAD+ kinase
MKIFFTSAHNISAQKAFIDLTARYGQSNLGDCDVVVALGGDGHAMRTLYDGLEHGLAVYAMRRTESVGFLCNEFKPDDIPSQVARAEKVILHPLAVTIKTVSGDEHEAHAINEVTMIRETPQAARLRVSVDGIERITKYSGDGVLVATPAGSPAYNHSCGGPIMPIDANTLVMTAISGYRPRGWRHAVLPQKSVVEIEALETAKRPVRIEAGSKTISNVAHVKISLDCTKNISLLFAPEEHLGERIVREQFML